MSTHSIRATTFLHFFARMLWSQWYLSADGFSSRLWLLHLIKRPHGHFYRQVRNATETPDKSNQYSWKGFLRSSSRLLTERQCIALDGFFSLPGPLHLPSQLHSSNSFASAILNIHLLIIHFPYCWPYLSNIGHDPTSPEFLQLVKYFYLFGRSS